MALFLAVLGGAAVVEVHRAITGGGNKDVALLRQKEEALKKQLQEIQRELQQAKSERELSAAEAAQLAAINAELEKAKEELEKESNSLKLEKEELKELAERLKAQEEILKSCAESLKLENSILIQQFEKLKIKHEQETAAFTEQLTALKENIGNTLQKFTANEINAQELVQFLSEMGVTLRCSEEDMARLERVAAVTATEEQRAEALEQVELKVEDSWLQQMRLVSSSQALAARLLMQGSMRETATANGPTRTLSTPRALEATEQKAAANKMTSHAVEESKQTDTIPALRAEAPAKEQKQKGASMVFRPIKKAVSKAVKNNKQPLVEVDVPVPRLSLDDLSEGPTGNSMVSM